jgi:hypothetical protein
MQPEAIQTERPQPRGMSELARIAGVFFEPKKTFADIAARPTWVLPLVLGMILALIYVTLIGQHIGWERIAAQQIAAGPNAATMTPEQRANAIRIGGTFGAVIGYGLVLLIAPIFVLVIAGVLMAMVAGVLSTPVKFKQMLAVVTWGGLPRGIMSILASVVVLIKNPDDFNIKNPLMFNPGAFMDPLTSNKFVLAIATSLDLFTLWVIVLMAIGIKAAGGKKLSFGSALFAVVLPWLIVVLISGAFAAMFS